MTQLCPGQTSPPRQHYYTLSLSLSLSKQSPSNLFPVFTYLKSDFHSSKFLSTNKQTIHTHLP
ncbi:hypothetical protein Hanom_Chr07g00622481 [Helianthus anomalus]